MLYQSPFLQLLQQLPPHYVVCIHQQETLTAAELIEKSKNLAANLAVRGIKKGDHVLLACDVGTEFLILFMALIHLRTKTALVDPHMGNQRYASKLKQFQPKCIAAEYKFTCIVRMHRAATFNAAKIPMFTKSFMLLKEKAFVFRCCSKEQSNSSITK